MFIMLGEESISKAARLQYDVFFLAATFLFI